MAPLALLPRAAGAEAAAAAAPRDPSAALLALGAAFAPAFAATAAAAASSSVLPSSASCLATLLAILAWNSSLRATSLALGSAPRSSPRRYHSSAPCQSLESSALAAPAA